ncbi:MAG: hypothetical protein D6751_07325 [Deltaproteobacteria bacterium]|nr:MAG: hypothetical protein D6751_07325 [Deltaproteobacteria bacterium]
MRLTEYTARPGQTIFDICIQHYGSLDGLQMLLEDNPDAIQDNGSIDHQRTWLIRKDEVLDKRVVESLQQRPPVTEGMPSGTGWADPALNIWITPTGDTWTLP